ncbi:TetR/AcrR family transcriptional regulator [Alcaligenes endophyticus]|uniref:TetR/AcrR family transcriptional regulator n=1 Tax=Alcaligenes endophyticus TaxID=1929088 RepID=A0ABT8EGV9_9BURK|nr:TetR/AcrR family transcriptional regulator [Alcaligenes endophyticus]MCX5589821.1 TetR/AcrR family transcriptional regulator [Alcaligenes endophyticus]MDN4120516.1 TetR/AcrR family transcriptional regulator [Alcaligenes endophyticus]
MSDSILLTGQRGPSDHHRRQQIIAQANAHFRLYGYRKTSVASLARNIGVSSAYLYRFFDSKQGIGQAICQSVLENITAQLEAVVYGSGTAIERLRGFTQTALDLSIDLFLNEGRMQEVVLEAISQKWPAVLQYERDLERLLTELIRSGRQSGEFERRCPIDEVALGAMVALSASLHPALLELQSAQEAQHSQVLATQLILRSLMP